MLEHLYRFRSIENLLGENRQELENQEIYFAPLHQLNDPMEGYKNIVWKGDEIVWKNLLIHYLMCFEQICSLQLIAGSDIEITPAEIPVFKTKEQFPTPEYTKIFAEICHLFFENPSAQNYPKSLAARTGLVRCSELYFYLRILHPHAINCIFSIYEKHNLVDKKRSNTKEYKVIDFESLGALNKVNYEHKNVSELIFFATNNTMQQLDLITKLNNESISTEKNKQFILIDFPEKYIKQLESLVHPEWYTACFMSSCNNSSVWGNYGDKHEGVCLKFKINNSESTQFIKLYGINGWGGSREKSGPIYGEIRHQFHKVRYSKKFPEIDFFKSLGRHSIPDLMSMWYTDENGKQSACAKHLFSNEEKWRNDYWTKFSSGTVTKLIDWKYENEYRLILSGTITDYSEVNTRKLKYSFQDLDGIIFGINTSEQNKLRILKVIDAKCTREKRSDFKFYQAFYSKQTGSIDHQELKFLTPNRKS